MKKNKKWRNDTKIFNSYSNFSYKCSCGHTVIMTNKVEKTICSYCGNYTFKTKEDEIKYRMQEAIKRNK